MRELIHDPFWQSIGDIIFIVVIGIFIIKLLKTLNDIFN